MIYNKPVTTIEEQIDQLIQRGLTVKDRTLARHWLSKISYYRLAGYWWPMQHDKKLHLFKPNSRFEDVLDLYEFDRELRLLVFDVIECIEIALRTKLIYFMSQEHGFWWFQNHSLFINAKAHAKALAGIFGELDRSKETFITEHNVKYSDDQRFPPAHKTMETTSMGSLSKLYGNLLPSVKSKDEIAKAFGTANHTYLHSWLQSITQIRNLCAHHSRLWNRNLPGKPKLLKHPPESWISMVPPSQEYHMLYVHLCCMKYLLNCIEPSNTFTDRLDKLLIKYPSVDAKALGMKPNWKNERLWE
jgi:abortive infection bacteriophage resistance protein